MARELGTNICCKDICCDPNTFWSCMRSGYINEPIDCFFSYCWDKIDKNDHIHHHRVVSIHNRLTAMFPNLRTFLDDKDLWGDRENFNRIDSALEESKVVIFCISRNYMKKITDDVNSTLRHEFDLAVALKKHYILLVLEPKSEDNESEEGVPLPTMWTGVFTRFNKEIVDYSFSRDIDSIPDYKFEELHDRILRMQTCFCCLRVLPIGTTDIMSATVFLVILFLHFYSVGVALFAVSKKEHFHKYADNTDVCLSNACVQILGSFAGLLFLCRSAMLRDSFAQNRKYHLDYFVAFMFIAVIVIGIINIDFNTICYDTTLNTANGNQIAVLLSINLVSIAIRMAYVTAWVVVKMRNVFFRRRELASRAKSAANALSRHGSFAISPSSSAHNLDAISSSSLSTLQAPREQAVDTDVEQQWTSSPMKSPRSNLTTPTVELSSSHVSRK
jgi:hypothetical protein